MRNKEDLDYILRNVSATYRANTYQDFDDFKEKAISFMDQFIPLFLPGSALLTAEEKEYIINEIKNSVPFCLPESSATCAEEYIYEDKWLENSDIKFDYTNRYLSYLSNEKGWKEESITPLKDDSFKVVQMLGNPCTDKIMHRKGLLIGDVQSGKTANYTAIMNRAVDVGFNVIVLLAGTTTSLRKQTQERIDLELVGRTEAKKNELVGVGKIAPLNKIVTATSTLYDYSKSIAKTQAAQIQNGQTLLFVTKKNVSNLASIIEALGKSNIAIKKEGGLLDASLLVIDDEADNASVDTKKPDKDPTTINKNIRELLHMFARTSYLAVTATPFANIFIDDEMKKDFGDDLFPSDFITVTNRPNRYIGAREFFGEVKIPETDRKGNMPELYSDACNEIIEDSEMEDTYKFKHKKDVKIDDFSELPASMQEAIRYFIIVQQLMDRLPGVGIHRTMMINVSRFVDVQTNLYKRISEWLTNNLIPQIRKNANYPDNAKSEDSGEFHQLKLVWDEFDLETLSGLTWKEFSPELLIHLSDLRVAVVNNGKESQKGNGLNYDANPNVDRVIAVGGQCLSRGLTLEGLVVSYFYRNSAAYDTLLQMGRWFGYRTAYLRYFKIWLSDASLRWYGMISEASDDLRHQVNLMRNLKMTPSQFGLGVRRHPYSNLIVTARNKMRYAKQSDETVITDLRCKLIETPRLFLEKTVNIKNAVLVRKFITEICAVGSKHDGYGGVYWKNVDKGKITDFIRQFSASKLSMGFSISDLSSYVKNIVEGDWDVGIAQSDDKEYKEYLISFDINNATYAPISRQYDIPEGEDVIRVSKHNVRVGTGAVTRLGLDVKEYKQLEEIYKNNNEAYWTTHKGGASVYLQEIGGFKRNNILILYPLWLHTKDKKTTGTIGSIYNDEDLPVVWAIGLGFVGDKPAEKAKQCFRYVVNPVAVAKGLGLSGELEEDDIDDD